MLLSHLSTPHFGGRAICARSYAIGTFSFAVFTPLQARVMKEVLGVPPRPGNVYTQFVKEHLPKRPENENIREYFSSLAAKWRSLDAQTKAKYEQSAKKLQDQYAKIKEDFEASLTPKKRHMYNLLKFHASCKRGLHFRGDCSEADDEFLDQIPPSPMASAYHCFIREAFKAGSTRSLKDIADKWRSLSLREKEAYQQTYKTETDRYASELRRFLSS